ncbi:phospholipase A2 [Actinoplanes sp. NEAU-A12]|uniref:Phospholipase A2 n=1 Tax=Actinoplanes sandaracinus TaxID=3045177 RepID=A0ABT6WHT1_9ACTN|nr:phospholipase A2 [Actinoplanes sandaracinus]MDI6099274.1 phospholipase A2 [Actinoplanes sandaracinus]
MSLSLASSMAFASPPEDQTVVISAADPSRPESVVLENASGPKSYQFAALVPEGGRLVPLKKSAAGDSFTSDVLVEDSRGNAVGAYEAPYAADAKGRLLPADYRIVGKDLVQTIELPADTAYPVTVNIAWFEPIGRVNPKAPAGQPSILAGISIPSNYVYDPSRGSLHDYCTWSPDRWRNVDFRGSCARHDMCYERPGQRKAACDNTFKNDLEVSCDMTYIPGVATTLNRLCYRMAKTYYEAVQRFGNDPS